MSPRLRPPGRVGVTTALAVGLVAGALAGCGTSDEPDEEATTSLDGVCAAVGRAVGEEWRVGERHAAPSAATCRGRRAGGGLLEVEVERRASARAARDAVAPLEDDDLSEITGPNALARLVELGTLGWDAGRAVIVRYAPSPASSTQRVYTTVSLAEGRYSLRIRISADPMPRADAPDRVAEDRATVRAASSGVLAVLGS